MRKIDNETRQAFLNCKNYSNNNTRVVVDSLDTRVELHGNNIATINHHDNEMSFNLCGWNTPTTRARINACLPDYCAINQVKGSVYFTNKRINKKVMINDNVKYYVSELMFKTVGL